MTEREDHTMPITYTQEFDVENRMITVTDNLTTTETIFTYDDTEQRTSTSVENAGDSRVITYFPFPMYEKDLHQVWECVPDLTGCSWSWSTEETIVRKTYSAGGQVIATRVSGDPNTANNGLFYFHSDHLGSATFLTHGNGHANEGLKVANSTKFYTPFGEYRIEPPSPVDGITDRGYTGHKHNDDIRLIYMNARYYVPSIGRFASADTIVPNPGNPQSFNRFSYVRNNPLNLIDPTGHIDECLDEDCHTNPSPQPEPEPEPEPLVDFDVDGECSNRTDDAASCTWTDDEKAVVEEGAWDVAVALARAYNREQWELWRMGMIDKYVPISPREAWFLAYGTTVTFKKTGQSCSDATGHDCWGRRANGNIEVYTDATGKIAGDSGKYWAVHELGHAFNAARVNATNGAVNPYGDLDFAFGLHGPLSAYSLKPRNGMNPYPWQQNKYVTDNEVFADYFLNWTYNSFKNNDDGKDQYRWMSRKMYIWLP